MCVCVHTCVPLYACLVQLLTCLVKLYTTVFSIRNIPLLEVAYTLLNADLEAAMKDLLHVMEERHTTIAPCEGDGHRQSKDQRSLSPYEAQGAVIFDLCILSRLSTTAKSVMGVSYSALWGHPLRAECGVFKT